MAAATPSAVLLYINSIAEASAQGKQGALHGSQTVGKKVHGGEPETIVVIGSNIRPNMEEEFGRSDTKILVRLDAGKNLIFVMSIPRDLKVDIPGIRPEKFNGAHSFGGPKLTVQVIKARCLPDGRRLRTQYPTEEKTVNGREYSTYTGSGEIKIVAWHRGENTSGSNDLQQSLTNEQMMGIVESCHLIQPRPKSARSKTQRPG